MSEKMNPLDQIEDLLNNIEKYTGVNWRDGQTPPLSAEYLNISEDALRDLLCDYEFGDGKNGIIQQILDLVYQSHDRSDKLESRAEKLEITVNGTPSVRGLVQRTTDLENRATNIENKNVEQDNSIKSLSQDMKESNAELDSKIEQNSNNIQTLFNTTATNSSAINNLNDDIDTLNIKISSNTSNINSLQSSLNEQSTKIENLEDYISSGTGELPENVIVSGDEVILYCGSSKDILHT